MGLGHLWNLLILPLLPSPPVDHQALLGCTLLWEALLTAPALGAPSTAHRFSEAGLEWNTCGAVSLTQVRGAFGSLALILARSLAPQKRLGKPSKIS